jgi:sugar phosphate isomerase/epimerase
MAHFRYSLNTSTIQPAGLLEKIEAARAAGYDGIELWITDVEAWLEQGRPLADVRKALDDAGLARPSMIYLKGWCDDDPASRAAALDLCRRRLDLARKLGVERIVAGPPQGIVPLAVVTQRYRELLETSVVHGVPASIEYLGFVQGVNTLEAAWEICRGADHPAATLTHDAWHLFRGGSNPATLEQIPAERISIVHWDDAPPQPPREVQTDHDRVMPGDGILPLRETAGQLRRMGYRRMLSLELFNHDYWRQDPLEVAREGLRKMKESVGDLTG